MPNSAGTWPIMMVIAAAETNPESTGSEMKSRMKLSLKRPKIKEYTPTMKVTTPVITSGGRRSQTNSAMIPAVMRPMIEVGPLERSVKVSFLDQYFKEYLRPSTNL